MLTKVILLVAAAVSVQAQPSESGGDLARARQLVADNKPLEAAAIYRELIRTNPNDLVLRVNLAVSLFKAYRYEEVIPVCLEALRRRPDLGPAWMFLGASYFQLHRTAEAIEPLKRAVDLQPAERNSRLMLGEALLLNGKFQDGLPHLKTAAQLLPNEPRVWYALERTWSALAEQEVMTIDAEARDSAVWLALAGDAALDKERYGLALHHYAESLKLRPDLPGVRESMAEAYRAAGHSEWASTGASSCGADEMMCALIRHDAETALRWAADSTEPESRYVRARAYRTLAASAFSKLLSLPESAQLHELKARRFDALGRFRDAVREWRTAVGVSDGNPTLEKGLAVALMNTGENAAAAPVLEKLSRRDPASSELMILIGRNLLALERPQDAVAWFRRALETNTSDTVAHAGLGEALLRIGKSKEALPHLTASLADDADGTRHYQLASAYRALGRAAEADAMVRQYKARQLALDRNRRDLEREVTAPERLPRD